MKKKIMLMLTCILAAGALAGCQSGGSAVEANSNSTETETPAGAEGQSEAPASDFDISKNITVMSREDGSGTRGAFIELFGIEVKNDDGTKKDMTTKEADIVNKTDVMMTGIQNNKYAIGYVSLGSLNDTVKAVDIEGVTASSENVKNGTYGVSRPFNIAYKDDLSDLAKDFVDYILSAQGQEVVAASYIAVDDNAPDYEASGLEGKIVVAGSSSVTPVMEKLKEAYEEINSGVTIEIQMSDSSAGMSDAISGTCDIGMASRDLKDSELEQLTGVEIALDGIAVIVNNDNSFSDLNKEQVRQIFTGEVTKWNEI